MALVNQLMTQGLCPAAAAAALPGMLRLGNSVVSPRSMLAPFWVGAAQLLCLTDLGAVFLLFFSWSSVVSLLYDPLPTATVLMVHGCFLYPSRQPPIVSSQ